MNGLTPLAIFLYQGLTEQPILRPREFWEQSALKRQKLHPISKIFDVQGFCNQFKVVYAGANINS